MAEMTQCSNQERNSIPCAWLRLGVREHRGFCASFPLPLQFMDIRWASVLKKCPQDRSQMG